MVASVVDIVEFNYENGLGRSDVVIKNHRKHRAVVVEAKAQSGFLL